jgi:hypothetical protein
MINWMDPGEDILAAKRIGFDEASECAAEQIEQIQDKLETARAENEHLKEQLKQAVGVIAAMAENDRIKERLRETKKDSER